jgi:hypothetical protein
MSDRIAILLDLKGVLRPLRGGTAPMQGSHISFGIAIDRFKLILDLCFYTDRV